jgi:hypothetical protein
MTEKKYFNNMMATKLRDVLNQRQQNRLWKHTQRYGLEDMPGISLSLIINVGLNKEEVKCPCCRRVV